MTMTETPNPMMTQQPLRRRGVLALAAGGLAVTLVPLPASAQLAPAVQAAIDRVRGSRTPQEGRVTLRLPPIAENGNTVPLTVSVESPMTAADHVKTIHVFATRNPTPEIGTLHLTPAMGRAQADVRIRLGETQDVVAIAEMADGSLFMGRAEVRVTIGGCGG